MIRLHGIDAPEAGQKCSLPSGRNWPCGEMAMDRLAELSGKRVSCKGTDTDMYGRLLGICSSPEGKNINEVMVAEGLAWAFRKYSSDYASAEDRAKASGIGIWRANTETPWDYRAAKWIVAKQVAPQGCPIKGNISENGHVYHTPWSPWYTRTKVTASKGERWFCTEREALDAGWRAAAWR
ncbi:thermonuclease family protein [Rhizobium giardinii]|uniref:thermonuclease family protein n=1 Tax=Rhizobium giardinii TaxID=56731 RepID=UPI003D6FA154